MEKKLRKHIRIRDKIFTQICFISLVFFSHTLAQTLSVQGKVTSSRYRMQNALVTFIDNSDTSVKISVLTDQSGIYRIDLATSTEPNANHIPTGFDLSQSYPNPFSSSTYIPYELNKESVVKVTIYDILGRAIRKFNVGQQTTGFHNVLWDGRNNFGNKVANGIYFYRLDAGRESQVKKMIFNGSSRGLVLVSRTYTSQLQKINKTTNQDIQAGNYTVRIENTDNSIPAVVFKQIDNVTIQNDTTINFSIDYIPVATVDFDSTHQIIRGFGASNVILWRPDMTSSEVETAFGMDDGQIGFSILRIMLEADSNRWNLYIPSAKKAYEMGATIIASPWFAPDDISEDVGSINRVRYDMYDKYAEHLNSFISYMANNGVDIYGISIQNEPDIEENWTSWTADEMFVFMRDYAHIIEGTKVMAPESFHFDRTYSDPILSDSVACVNTDIICGHIYGGGLTAYPLAEEKGKEVWMTEYLINSPGSGTNMDTSWTAALETAKSINGCMNAGMSAYVWWYIVRYYGPICDGSYLRKGEITKKGYVMSQFSKFIRPGFYRVESSVYPPLGAADITAYKDPSSSKVVIVAVNTSSEQLEQVFRIQNGTTITFTPYTTSELKNCEKGDDFTVTGSGFTITLEPQSITTFVSN